MKLVMVKHETEDDPSSQTDKVEFALRALRAMQVLCERRLAGNDEPVTYVDNKIKGFIMTIHTGQKCMMVGCQVGLHDQIRAAAALLASIREELPESKFYELLMMLYKGTAAEDDTVSDIEFHKRKGGES